MSNNALTPVKGNDGQQTLADFSTYRQQINTESDETEADESGKPNWNPGQSNDDTDDELRHECLSCGSSVSADYIRVMAPSGTENVERCPNCSSMSERRNEGVSQR